MNSKYHIFSLIIPILLKEQRQWKKLKIDQPRGPSTRSNHLEDETHQESLYRKAWSYLHGKHLGRCLKIEFTVQKFIALLACFSVKTLAADGRGSLFFALPFLLLLVCWSADQVVFLVVQGSGKLASGSNDGDQDFWNRITTWRVNALPSLLLLLFVFSQNGGRPKLLPSHGVWKSQKKVSFNFASEASYVSFYANLTVKQCYQTVQLVKNVNATF